MNREAAQFMALRNAQTTADTSYGKVVAALAGQHYDLERAQGRVQNSGSRLADTLTRRFIGAVVIAQARNLVSAIVALNAEMARTADISRRTGTASALFQGIQGAAQNKGIDAATIDEAMLKLSHGIAKAKNGTGELGMLFRANNLTLGTTAETLFKLADLVKNARTDADKFAFAQQAGLPATRDMVKFLEQGSEAIKKQADAVKPMTDAQLQAQERINARWNEIWAEFARAGKRAFVEIFDPATWQSPLVKALPGGAITSAMVYYFSDLKAAAGRSAGAASAATGASKFLATPGPGESHDVPKPPEKPSQNPQDQINAIQRQQQLISLYGQTATVAEIVKQKENELHLARLQSNITIGDRAELVKRLAYEQALGLTAIQSATDAQKMESATIGMAAGPAAAYRAETNLLNEARRNGKELLAKHIVDIKREAEALGAATAYAEGLRWGYENLARGPLEELRSGLQNGEKFFDALGQAGRRALESISSKLIEMAALDAWRALMGGGSGGAGGILKALGLGGGGNNLSQYMMGSTVVPLFAGGGVMTPAGPVPLRHYAKGGVANSPQAAIFGEGRLPEAYVPLPDGRSIPVTMQGGSQGGDTIVVHLSVDASNQTDGNAIGQTLSSFVRSPTFKGAVKAAVREARSRREM